MLLAETDETGCWELTTTRCSVEPVDPIPSFLCSVTLNFTGYQRRFIGSRNESCEALKSYTLMALLPSFEEFKVRSEVGKQLISLFMTKIMEGTERDSSDKIMMTVMGGAVGVQFKEFKS